MNRYRYPNFQRPATSFLSIGQMWKKKDGAVWNSGSWPVNLHSKIKISGFFNNEPIGQCVSFTDPDDQTVSSFLTACPLDKFKEMYEPI